MVSPGRKTALYWFGVAAVLGAILVRAVVQQNLLLIEGIVALGSVIVLPVEASLGVFALLVPSNTILELWHSGITLVRVAGAFAGAILLVYGFLSGRLRRPPTPALWWSVFVLWSAASLMWAVDEPRSLDRMGTAASLFALYFTVVCFRTTRRELSRVLLLAVAGGAVAAALVIYDFTYSSGLLRGTLVLGDKQANPNDLAGSLLLPFALALAGLFSGGALLKRTALFAALALVTIAIFLTMSRGGLISLCIVVLTYLLKLGVRRTLVPVLVLSLSLFFMPSQFSQRLKEAPSGRGTGRYDIWIAGLEIVKHNPVVGVGLGSFPLAYNDAAGYAPIFRGYHKASHNMYLDVWAELGIIGFAFFCAAIWSQIRYLRRASNGSVGDYYGIAVEAACWGLLVQGLSGNIEWEKSLWLTSMLLALVARQAQRETEFTSRLTITSMTSA